MHSHIIGAAVMPIMKLRVIGERLFKGFFIV
jgi:hypothetical protein